MSSLVRSGLVAVLFGCVACVLCLAGPILQSPEPPLVTPGMHPNFDLALPADLENLSGLTVGELSREFPQNAFAFSGAKVGYFDPTRPWLTPVWTVRARPGTMEVIPGSPSIQPPPVHPPPVQPPNEAATPEPGTVVAGIAATALILWRLLARNAAQANEETFAAHQS